MVRGGQIDGQPTPVVKTAALACACTSPLVTLDGVSVRRGGKVVLREVSFALAHGQVTAIVGRSGVGKTTLVNVLNGLVRPERGWITVTGGGGLDDGETLSRHRRRIATVFQEHALIDRLSALDNVLLGLADQRHPLSLLPWPAPMRRRAAQALEMVGLLNRAGERASRLSGGERQRVGIARALVRNPEILLGDEPFAAVDPTLVAHLGRIFRHAARDQGVAVLLVLHQIETATVLADRIVGLADGGVVWDGPANAFDAEARMAVFGSRPALVE